MEKSEDFQKVVADIKQLEDHLLSLGEDAEKITKYGEEMEREVEKHFMSCINALAARQESLLRELGEKINIQSMSSLSSSFSLSYPFLYPSALSPTLHSLASLPHCH